MATRSKKPKCNGSTSQSCGMSCISREDTCREQIAAEVAARLVSVATQYKQANDSAGQSFDAVMSQFPPKLLKEAHKTGVATKDLSNGAVLTTKEAVGLDGSKIKYGFVTDADGKRYTVSDGLVKEVTGAAGSEWGEAFEAAVRSKVAVVEAKAEVKSKPKLPSSVTTSRDDFVFVRNYKFSVGSNLNVELYIKEGYKGSDIGDEVGFSVNGKYSDESPFTKRQGAEIALTLASIIKYDVSIQPEGHKYNTSATIIDGNGYKRAAAYERLGFSRPSDGIIGEGQYGIVKDGKLVPNLAYLELTDEAEPRVIERRMLENKKKRLQAKRDQQL